MQVGIGYKEDRMSKQRPSVISLLAALNAFAGALLFLSGIALLDGGQGTIFQDTGAVGVGLIFLIASGINFVIAVGMWRLWTPIRDFSISYSFVSLIVLIPLILMQKATFPFIMQVIAQIVGLLIFLDINIRDAFDATSYISHAEKSNYPDMTA
jgi:hypothetical protein